MYCIEENALLMMIKISIFSSLFVMQYWLLSKKRFKISIAMLIFLLAGIGTFVINTIEDIF